MLKKTRLPLTTRFHDLRHYMCDTLDHQGVHARVVMEILGHANITITMNTYAHMLPEVSRAAAERLDALFAVDEADKGTDKDEDGVEQDRTDDREDEAQN
jgi:integrase